MPESSLVKDVRSSSPECRTSPSRQLYQPLLPLQRSSYMLAAFCTDQNVQQCALHINQEVSSLGLPPVWTQSTNGPELNVVAGLNCMYDLIQLHRKGVRTLENLEMEQHKLSSNVAFLQLTSTRLKEQLELSKRENTGLAEKERQLQLRMKNLQNRVRHEKEEGQKLQNIIASRSSQYNHEMKRKEREFTKMKERLNQLLADKKEKKQVFPAAIDMLNNIGRADGKRSLWKTEKTEAKHEGEMYQTLLSDYDSRQRELMLENAELRKVLQQMKKDMMSVLSSTKATLTGEKQQDDGTQAGSQEEDEVFDSSQESVELYCVHARDKLTKSIRLQWRRFKCHIERLDSQASLAQVDERKNSTVSLETHEEEMDRLKIEIQQCKDFIQTQQQMLQQQLGSPCDEETVPSPSNCYMSQGKERLREEWKTLEEQRGVFERERRKFTEAAIRLSHERKTFEEDRATWLKHQFLNFSPFADSKKPLLSKSKSTFLLSEREASLTLAPEKSQSDTTSPTHRSFLLTSTLTAENSSNGHSPGQKKWWDNSSEEHDGESVAQKKISS